MTAWGDFRPFTGNLGPYAEWWETHEGTLPRNQSAFGSAAARSVDLEPYSFRDATFGGLPQPAAPSRSRTSRSYYDASDRVPIPEHSINHGWNNGDDWLTPDLDSISPVAADTVILGIIDTGIPIGHRRFRLENGKTRFLAAWQQTATYGGQVLPFGRELKEMQINHLLGLHSREDRLDEDALNRAAGLVEPHLPTGHRDLDYRASHGAHVLDLAAGMDAHLDVDTAELARRLRILAVNLPPQFLHGPAGDYLQFFASWGLRRIVALADALWQRDHKDHPQGAFPIALNMSYGMQAGPKDGSMLLDRLMSELLTQREPATGRTPTARKPPLRIHMPAGNSNLYRCAARLKLDPQAEEVLGWRIQPDDQTSNHVELWTPPYDDTDALEPSDFEIALALPNAAPVWAPTPLLAHFAPFGSFARLSCFEHWLDPAGSRRRIVFLISAARTYGTHPAAGNLAPAGLWRIFLRGPEQIEIEAYVQSDQSLVLESPIGRRSYFDDEGYRRYWESGRPADSFCYGSGEPAPGSGPVSRLGTHNALGTGPEIATIGGYRQTDGRPAIYSSTGRSDGDITAAYPSEDGAAYPGLLAAGSRGGSAVRFSGTSMTTALATRDVALDMLAHSADWSSPGLFDKHAIAAKAIASEGVRQPGGFKHVSTKKSGAGRIRMPPRHRTKSIPQP